MNRKDILAVYAQGPEAVVSLVQHMSQHIKKLDAHIEKLEKPIVTFEHRIQELEFRTKKTPKTVISHLLRMGYINPKRQVYVEKQNEKQVDNRDMSVILFISRSFIILI